MPPGITCAGERAQRAHPNGSTGRAVASQGWHRIIPPGTCHLSITQDTSLTRHHLNKEHGLPFRSLKILTKGGKDSFLSIPTGST